MLEIFSLKKVYNIYIYVIKHTQTCINRKKIVTCEIHEKLVSREFHMDFFMWNQKMWNSRKN